MRPHPALPIAALALLTACATEPPTPPVGLPNPASAYCVDQGGKLEIRTASDGGQSGWCHLPDGRVVEEWTLYRGEGK